MLKDVKYRFFRSCNRILYAKNIKTFAANSSRYCSIIFNICHNSGSDIIPIYAKRKICTYSAFLRFFQHFFCRRMLIIRTYEKHIIAARYIKFFNNINDIRNRKQYLIRLIVSHRQESILILLPVQHSKNI